MVSVSFSVSEVYFPGHRHIRSLPVSLEIRDHRRIAPRRRSDKTADFPSGCVDQKRSEEHTSELQSLMRISYAVFCLKKKNIQLIHTNKQTEHTTAFKLLHTKNRT